MKKYLTVGLLFLFMGCSWHFFLTPIESINGSFRDSLNPKYYEKSSFRECIGVDPVYQNILIDVDIDEVVRHGLITIYLSNTPYVGYIKLNKYGVIPGLDDNKLCVSFRQTYKFTGGMGYEIIIWEGNSLIGGVDSFVTNQEISLDEKGKFIIRENVPRREAIRKEVEWDNRFK